MHCLRHTCASRLLARGNIVVVSKWLGHSDISVTMRYLKLEKNAFAGAAAALAGVPCAIPSVESLHGTRSLHVSQESSGRGTREIH
jgi:hypothetical protein